MIWYLDLVLCLIWLFFAANAVGSALKKWEPTEHSQTFMALVFLLLATQAADRLSS